MLTNRKIKEIQALKEKKNRQKSGFFCVEGLKSIKDIFDSGHMELVELYVTELYADAFSDRGELPMQLITPEQLRKISSWTTPSGVLAVFRVPHYDLPDLGKSALYLVLDGIRDPGNLGTIIRLADWFGVQDVLCSPDTVDLYNPKVVQATMGSIARVRVHYTDLVAVLQKTNAPIYGAFLEGENLYKKALSEHAVIMIGNESVGISPQCAALVGERITIPSYNPTGQVESLNAAMATSVLLSEFRSKALAGR